MQEILDQIITIKDFSKFLKKIKEFELENRLFSKKSSFKTYIELLKNGIEYCPSKTRFFLTGRIFTKIDTINIVPFIILNNDCENFKLIKNGIKDYEMKSVLYLAVDCIGSIEIETSVSPEIYNLISSCLKEESSENNTFWWNEFFRLREFSREEIQYFYNKKFDFNINIKAFSRLLEKFLKNNLIITSYQNRIIKESNLGELENELSLFIQLYIDLPESFRQSRRNKEIVKVFDKMIKRQLFLMDCKS